MNSTPNSRSRLRPAFTVIEIIVAVTIVTVLSTIAVKVTKSAKERAHLARATQKIKNLGEAFVAYTVENGGLLPLEDAPGSDDWTGAQRPEASEVWYNALPRLMGSPTVGELADNPEAFYQDDYPLYVPGAPYPKGDKKFKRPYFAIGMNSRLQRKNDDGVKDQETLASIQVPADTVAFLERGLPGDERFSKAQRSFNGNPKANPRAMAHRHNRRGLLLFFDGHVELRQASEVIERTGRIKYPQREVIWTRDPEEDPN